MPFPPVSEPAPRSSRHGPRTVDPRAHGSPGLGDVAEGLAAVGALVAVEQVVLHDVGQLAGLVLGDHQVTVEGLDPEPPAFWQLQLAAEGGRALLRGQALVGVGVVGLHDEDFAAGRIEEVNLAALVVGEGVVPVDVPGEVVAPDDPLLQGRDVHDAHPGHLDPAEFLVVSGFEDPELVEHPVTGRIQEDPEGLVLLGDLVLVQGGEPGGRGVVHAGGVVEVGDGVLGGGAGEQGHFGEAVAPHVVQGDLPVRDPVRLV